MQGLREASVELTGPSENGVSEGSVLIRAGMNKVGSRFYTEEFLKGNLDRFEGGFCNADHPTESQARDLPERSVLSLAAVVKGARWDPAQQAVLGDVHYLGTSVGADMREAFRDDVVRANAGLSIYWPGRVTQKRQKIGEAFVNVPTALIGAGRFDVDFVTRPGAGGKVAPIKEEGEDMADEKKTLEALREEFPELKGLVDPAGLTQAAMQEAHPDWFPKVDPEPSKPDPDLTQRVATLEKENHTLRLQQVIREAIAAEKLPDDAAELVRERFAEVVEGESVALGAAVKAYATKVRETLQKVAGTSGPYGTAPDGDDGKPTPIMESVRKAWGIPAPSQPESVKKEA